MLTVRQLTHRIAAGPYAPGIADLMARYAPILCDAQTPPGSLLENTLICLPLLWVLTDSANAVLAVAVLDEPFCGHHARIYGVSYPALRRNPNLTRLARTVLGYGFEALNLAEIHAEFDPPNPGALGFCRRMGFSGRGASRYVLNRERFYSLFQPKGA